MVTNQSGPVLRGSPYRADCPTRHILDRIGDRWTVLIVGALWDGSARFSELRRRIEGISQEMLTQTLRGLGMGSCAGPSTLRFQYASSTRSPRRAVPCASPCALWRKWSSAHLSDVSAAQDAYDRAD